VPALRKITLEKYVTILIMPDGVLSHQHPIRVFRVSAARWSGQLDEPECTRVRGSFTSFAEGGIGHGSAMQRASSRASSGLWHAVHGVRPPLDAGRWALLEGV
jgi:hypothetical protein